MQGAIRRPDAPDHFMVLKPAGRRIVVRLPDGTILADSTNAVRLLEAGKTLYDPMIYLPKEDVLVPLIKRDRETWCPLKGHASYFSVEQGPVTHSDLAWSYEQPLEFSKDIQSLVAFYPDRVIVEEHPL